MTKRETIRVGLFSAYLPLYNALCAELPECWQPYWGLRTFAQQDSLYAQGRTQPGRIITNARGGQSAHNYGCATDWTLWDDKGKPIWLTQDDPRWIEYMAALNKVGLRWGGDFPTPDKFHNEIKLNPKTDWILVQKEFIAKDLKASYDLISKNVVV